MVSPSTAEERDARPTIRMDAPADAVAEPLYVNVIQWLSASAVAGDLLTIVDADGYVVCKGVADGPNLERFYPIYHQCQGLRVQSLGSGEVLVYLRGSPAYLVGDRWERR